METAAEIMEGAAAVWLPIDDLVPWGENPRRIPESAVRKVAISMCALGYGAPALIRAQDKRLVAGHTRRKAFLFLLELADKHGIPPDYFIEVDPETGERTKHHRRSPLWVDKDESKQPPEWYWWMKDEVRNALEKRIIPVRAMDLTEQEADELALADNRLGEEAEWDQDLLSQVLQSLPHDEHLLTGFDASELEPLLAYQAPLPPDLGDGNDGDGQEGDNPSKPPSPLTLRLDPAQRAAFESALETGRAYFERPDMPGPEFVAVLSRRFMEDEKVSVHVKEEKVAAPKPSAGMFDF